MRNFILRRNLIFFLQKTLAFLYNVSFWGLFSSYNESRLIKSKFISPIYHNHRLIISFDQDLGDHNKWYFNCNIKTMHFTHIYLMVYKECLNVPLFVLFCDVINWFWVWKIKVELFYQFINFEQSLRTNRFTQKPFLYLSSSAART